MFRPRVIPCLLLRNNGLYKSVKFKNHRYIGDPMNAIKIFNDKKADELIFLDIDASQQNRTISIDLVKQLGDECNMPFTVGGGISSLDQIRGLLNAGAEKVSLNSSAFKNPKFIEEAALAFGSSTIVVSIDVKKKFLGKKQVFLANGTKSTGIDPLEFAKKMADHGAGELLVNSIDHDGTMEGYDLDLIQSISSAVSVPVIACGGAGRLDHMVEANMKGKASAMAAGSLFVYHGPRRAVLINLPTRNEVNQAFKRY